MGESPYWYRLIAAARFLGVPVWELAEAPIFWMHAALAAEYAEAHATEMKTK